jgi:protein TonB
MTAASLGPGPSLFTFLSESRTHSRSMEAFVFSFLVQAGILAIIVYFTTIVIRAPGIDQRLAGARELPLIFSGFNGGGGGNFDPLPASRGNPPRASLDPQLVPPTVIVPKEMPRLPVEPTVIVAPEIKFPQGGTIGDPTSLFSNPSDGSGGPGGTGKGCCDGLGDSSGPHVGSGPPGIYPAGRGGVTIPEAIFSPEPSFSEEARKAKAQGIVLLTVVVGKDGRPYDLRIAQSLGMGLDEKAIEAVTRWRFRPATLNGQPIASRVAVQVDFHLY